MIQYVSTNVTKNICYFYNNAIVGILLLYPIGLLGLTSYS